MTPEDNDSVTLSSGNVFADMGLPDADELLIKADLASAITAILKERKLTQMQAAKVLGIDQPKVSRLMRSGLYGFSIEQLIHLLGVLGQKVSFTIEPVAAAAKREAKRKSTGKAA
jgi:predicted XRE-type DNA-binding protein